MNKSLLIKTLIVGISVSVALSVCIAAGCNSTDGETKKESEGTTVTAPENPGDNGDVSAKPITVTSYVSTDSHVYSSTAEVVTAVADSVVEISTEYVTTRWGKQYIVSGAGSGVIVGNSDNSYYIVTNNHVIDGAQDITVKTRSGENFAAELVATDDSADIAVVTISSEYDLKVAVWGNSDDLQIGEDLIAIGNPLGSLGGTVTKGILSAKGRVITVGNFDMTLLQTDTAINPGNSGGGLFNMRGELIGVVNAKTTDEQIEGICFAIPSNTAKSVYDDLINFGYIKGRVSLGIAVTELSGNGSQTIVCVTKVLNAADGTFELYDGIKAINGEQVSSVLEFNRALAKLNLQDAVEIEVYRGTLVSGWISNSVSFSSETTKFTVVASQFNA